MFQRTTVPSSSGSSSPKGTTTLQNIRNYSPNVTFFPSKVHKLFLLKIILRLNAFKVVAQTLGT
jgi:hypothetical protein